jgi:hypothetical protein
LRSLQARYGKFFDSYAPDFNFCYRVLEMEESILFQHEALLLNYAMRRSNGASISRGEMTQDRADFAAHLSRSQNYYAAPIPDIITVRNAIAHEYCLVREETRSAKLPPLDKQKYLRAIAEELREIVNPPIKHEIEALLAAHGLATPDFTARQMPLVRKLLSPRRVADKLTREARSLRAKLPGGASRPQHRQSPSPVRGAHRLLEFESVQQALDHAIRFPRTKLESEPALEELLQLEPVAAQGPASASASPALKDSPAMRSNV